CRSRGRREAESVGAAEVDQAQPARAAAGIGQGLRQGVGGIARLARVVALRQAHHGAFAHVDGGIDGEAHTASRKLRSSRAPAVADRSGWNWAPATRPRSTTAANIDPCTVSATQSAPGATA